MLKKLTMMLSVVALSAATLAAQAKPTQTTTPAKPAAEAKPEPAAPKAPPEPPPLPLNIKIEVSITDQSGTNPPAKKVVTMIASDRMSTNVRSSASVPVKQTVFTGPPNGATVATPSYSYRTVQINVDARPAIVQKDPNKISMNFGLEYLPTTRLSAQEEGEPGLTSWNERLSVILESGKPMVVSQAADPTSDRKITVEVTATILK
jgi:hypothetical protein